MSSFAVVLFLPLSLLGESAQSRLLTGIEQSQPVVNRRGEYTNVEPSSTPEKAPQARRAGDLADERILSGRNPEIQAGSGEGQKEDGAGIAHELWQPMCFIFHPAVPQDQSNNIIYQMKEAISSTCQVNLEVLPYESKDMPSGMAPDQINESSKAACNKQHIEEFFNQGVKDVKVQSYPLDVLNADKMCGEEGEKLKKNEVAGCAALGQPESIVDFDQINLPVSAHEYLHTLGGIHCAEIESMNAGKKPEDKFAVIEWGFGICENTPGASKIASLHFGQEEFYGPAFPEWMNLFLANGGAGSRGGASGFQPAGCAAIQKNSVKNDGSHKFDPEDKESFNPKEERDYYYSRDASGGYSFIKPAPEDAPVGAGGAGGGAAHLSKAPKGISDSDTLGEGHPGKAPKGPGKKSQTAQNGSSYELEEDPDKKTPGAKTPGFSSEKIPGFNAISSAGEFFGTTTPSEKPSSASSSALAESTSSFQTGSDLSPSSQKPNLTGSSSSTVPGSIAPDSTLSSNPSSPFLAPGATPLSPSQSNSNFNRASFGNDFGSGDFFGSATSDDFFGAPSPQRAPTSNPSSRGSSLRGSVRDNY